MAGRCKQVRQAAGCISHSSQHWGKRGLGGCRTAVHSPAQLLPCTHPQQPRPPAQTPRHLGTLLAGGPTAGGQPAPAGAPWPGGPPAAARAPAGRPPPAPPAACQARQRRQGWAGGAGWVSSRAARRQAAAWQLQQRQAARATQQLGCAPAAAALHAIPCAVPTYRRPVGALLGGHAPVPVALVHAGRLRHHLGQQPLHQQRHLARRGCGARQGEARRAVGERLAGRQASAAGRHVPSTAAPGVSGQCPSPGPCTAARTGWLPAACRDHHSTPTRRTLNDEVVQAVALLHTHGVVLCRLPLKLPHALPELGAQLNRGGALLASRSQTGVGQRAWRVVKRTVQAVRWTSAAATCVKQHRSRCCRALPRSQALKVRLQLGRSGGTEIVPRKLLRQVRLLQLILHPAHWADGVHICSHRRAWRDVTCASKRGQRGGWARQRIGEASGRLCTCSAVRRAHQAERGRPWASSQRLHSWVAQVWQDS